MRYLRIMKSQLDTTHGAAGSGYRDIDLPGGCILCGGDLAVRIGERGGATSFCSRCRWISRPHMRHHDGAVQVVHPAGGIA